MGCYLVRRQQDGLLRFGSWWGVGLADSRMGRAGLSRCPDWPALQGSSLQVGSDLLKFEEPVTMQEPGTFSFRTPKVQLLGRAGQAAGPRLPAELEGPSGRRLPPPCSAEEAEVAGQAGVASEHVCFLLSAGVKVIISVSETLAFPCCPSAMRVHRGTVVTPGLGWEQEVQHVPVCAPSCPMMATRRCPCTCMSSLLARTSTASSKVGEWGWGWAAEASGGRCEVALLTAGFFLPPQ